VDRKLFKSRKDLLLGIVIWVPLLALLVTVVTELFNTNQAWNGRVFGLLVMSVTIGFIGWMWFGTHYTIDHSFVYYRSGPFRGKIAVSSIREVVIGETMWSGFRPATARRGLILKYNRYDEIYFSPDSNVAFVGALQKVNPEIRITEVK